MAENEFTHTSYNEDIPVNFLKLNEPQAWYEKADNEVRLPETIPTRQGRTPTNYPYATKVVLKVVQHRRVVCVRWAVPTLSRTYLDIRWYTDLEKGQKVAPSECIQTHHEANQIQQSDL